MSNDGEVCLFVAWPVRNPVVDRGRVSGLCGGIGK